MNYVIYTTTFFTFLTILFIYIRNRNRRRGSKRRSADINKPVNKVIEQQEIKEEKRKTLIDYVNPPRQMTEYEKQFYKIKPNLQYWYEKYHSLSGIDMPAIIFYEQEKFLYENSKQPEVSDK